MNGPYWRRMLMVLLKACTPYHQSIHPSACTHTHTVGKAAVWVISKLHQQRAACGGIVTVQLGSEGLHWVLGGMCEYSDKTLHLQALPHWGLAPTTQVQAEALLWTLQPHSNSLWSAWCTISPWSAGTLHILSDILRVQTEKFQPCKDLTHEKW